MQKSLRFLSVFTAILSINLQAETLPEMIDALVKNTQEAAGLDEKMTEIIQGKKWDGLGIWEIYTQAENPDLKEHPVLLARNGGFNLAAAALVELGFSDIKDEDEAKSATEIYRPVGQIVFDALTELSKKKSEMAAKLESVTNEQESKLAVLIKKFQKEIADEQVKLDKLKVVLDENIGIVDLLKETAIYKKSPWGTKWAQIDAQLAAESEYTAQEAELKHKTVVNGQLSEAAKGKKEAAIATQANEGNALVAQFITETDIKLHNQIVEGHLKAVNLFRKDPSAHFPSLNAEAASSPIITLLEEGFFNSAMALADLKVCISGNADFEAAAKKTVGEAELDALMTAYSNDHLDATKALIKSAAAKQKIVLISKASEEPAAAAGGYLSWLPWRTVEPKPQEVAKDPALVAAEEAAQDKALQAFLDGYIKFAAVIKVSN